MQATQLQQTIINEALSGKNNIVVEAGPGSGKCLGINTPILMFDGTIKMVQDIVVGDLLMGPDNLPRTVLSLATGIDNMYKIIPVKGESFVCNEPHILSLVYSGTKKNGNIYNISVNEYLQLPTNSKLRERLKLYRTDVLEFEEKSITIDPYILGVWLGDGNSDNFTISTPDQEIVNTLYEYCKTNNYEVTKYNLNDSNACPMYNIIGGARTELRNLNLFNNKHIPNNYKLNTIEVRKQILAGLLDTDGYYGNGYYEICTKFDQLNEDILFVARSLGLAAYSTVKIVLPTKNNNGGTYHRITISGELSQLPLRVERKKALQRKQIKNVLRTGFTVEYIGKDNYYGFEIDGDHLFVLGDFTVTHNTSTLKLVTDALLKYNYNTKILAISYTNTIKNTLKEKLDDRVSILSIHQMGLSLLNSAFRPKFKFDERLHGKKGSPDNKYKIIFEDIIFSDFEMRMNNALAFETMGLCINLINKIRLELIDENVDSEIYRIVNKYHIDGVVDEKVIGFIRTALNIGQAYYHTKGWYDFVDMLYLPIKFNIEPKLGMSMGNKTDGFILNKLDWILCDEFQDASVIIHKVIEKFQRTFKSKLLLVGDKNQSCFAFAAADTKSMDKAATLFNCKQLPLNETFRCPESHVEFLNERFGTNLISRRNKPGTIQTIAYTELLNIIQPGAMVLARTNQELMVLFLSLLQSKIPARLIKFDLLDFFDDLISQINKKIGMDWENPYATIEDFLEEEFAIYRRKYNKYRAYELIAEMQSNVDVLIAYIEFIKPTTTDMFFRKVEQMLDNNNKGNYVSLLNCHIGKGLEAENVFILGADKFPYIRDGMNSEDIQQETNLFFVACSRSLENLYLVNSIVNINEDVEEE